MKLQKKEISSDGNGRVTLVPLEANDLWYLFRLLDVGNTVKIRTVRKVIKETSNGTTSSAERKVVMMILKISRVEYDPSGGSLRVSGQNIGESEFIRLGQHHSADVQFDTPICIGKSHWDSVDLKHIAESCDASLNADVAAIILDNNSAHLYLVTPNMCIEKSSIQNSGTKKKYTNSGIDGKQEKYFKQIMQGMIVHVNRDKVKAIIVASPRNTNAHFVEYMRGCREGALAGWGSQCMSKVLICRVESTTTDALKEAFADPAVLKKLSDTKFAQEIKILNSFLRKLCSQPDMVAYGYAAVKAACSFGAVDCLMVSDSLTESVGRHRAKLSALIEEVHSLGGSVNTLSSMHASGKQLERYTGVAALLRFSCPDLEVSDRNSVNDSEAFMNKLSLSSKADYHTCYDGRMLVKEP